MTFSKLDTVVQTPSVVSGQSSKPDLPGRVSFSKPDVFAADFSDGDEDSAQSQTSFRVTNIIKKGLEYDRPIINQVNKQQVNEAVVPDAPLLLRDDTKDYDDTKSCCSLKCNSLLETMKSLEMSSKSNFDQSDNASASKLPNKNDESDRIIADYRREIEKLNREHSKDLASIQNNLYLEQATLSKSPDPFVSPKATPKKHDEVISKIISAAWNNHQSIIKGTDHKSYTKQSIFETKNENESEKVSTNTEEKKPSADSELDTTNTNSTSIVIDNYLKTTNRKPFTTSTPVAKMASQPSTNSDNLKANKNIGRLASKSAPLTSLKTLKPIKRITTSATKSKSVVEDNRLNEFQMEKVESWMSIHEFSKTTAEPKGDQIESADDVNRDSGYNQSWRDTPSSKTDDEGMFSFDDQLEGDESTTYEDIVSVIKEIDEQTNHDLGKSII